MHHYDGNRNQLIFTWPIFDAGLQGRCLGFLVVNPVHRWPSETLACSVNLDLASEASQYLE